MEKTENKLNQFADLVFRMRNAQKKYFKSPSGSDDKKTALIDSKQLEKEVDYFIDEQFSNQIKIF